MDLGPRLTNISQFSTEYKAYSYAYIGKEQNENSGKGCFLLIFILMSSSIIHKNLVFLPPDVLEKVQHLLDNRQPLMFEIRNEHAGFRIHCGVAEFSAHSGTIIMPYWVCFRVSVPLLLLADDGVNRHTGRIHSSCSRMQSPSWQACKVKAINSWIL